MPAKAFERPLKLLQLVLKVGQFRLVDAQLVFSVTYVCLSLLLLGLEGFESRLKLRKRYILNVVPLRQTNLATAYDVFLTLDFGGQVFVFILDLCKLQAGLLQSLRGVRDRCLLRLQAIEENLHSLRCRRRVAQLHSQLADLCQQSLQCL